MRVLLLSLLIALNSLAATTTKKSTDTSAETPVQTEANKAGTGRKHNFEDLLVNGKYHFADEAVSTVEADKVFDSLIGVRTDFKDRLEESASNK